MSKYHHSFYIYICNDIKNIKIIILEFDCIKDKIGVFRVKEPRRPSLFRRTIKCYPASFYGPVFHIWMYLENLSYLF